MTDQSRADSDESLLADWQQASGRALLTESERVDLLQLIRAARSPHHPAPVGAWQPIDTAPKDGTNIMLTNGVHVAQGWWFHEEPYIREQRDLEGRYIDQAESDGFDGWLDCDGGMQPDPTHWMPLPAPLADKASLAAAPAPAEPAAPVLKEADAIRFRDAALKVFEGATTETQDAIQYMYNLMIAATAPATKPEPASEDDK